VLAVVVLSTVATYFASAGQAKRYRSDTRVFVSASQIQGIVSGSSSGTDRDTQDQAQLMVSRPVTDAVIRRLHLRETAETLSSTVDATPSSNSNFVTFSAERASGREAADVANAFVREYIAYRGLRLVREVDPAIRASRRQLRGLPKGDAGAQQRTDLQVTIRQLQAARAVASSQARQTDLATAPGQPFSPRPKRDAAFGLVISLALAFALVSILDRFDRRIARPEEVASAYDAPLLSVIPHSDRPNVIRDGMAAVPDTLREPFRALRTNLQLASLDKPVRCLTVTSAIPGEGKSTIVRNLALTYQEWGLNVVVVEADLRSPTLSRLFGVDTTDVGLTSVLTGEVGLDDALADIEVDHAGVEYLDKVRARSTAARGVVDRGRAGARLALLASGETPPNPQAVLATDTMRQIIEQLAERFDMVLIDTPPLLAVGDAVPFLSQSDGVIIVARIGLTDRGAGARVMEAARLVPDAQILGVVANDLPPELGGSYGYGYGYGYSNGSAKS
jgi:receptor protein-tyrosine kinase